MSKFITIPEDKYNKLEELANANEKKISQMAKKMAISNWSKDFEESAEYLMMGYKRVDPFMKKITNWYKKLSWLERIITPKPPKIDIWFYDYDFDIEGLRIDISRELHAQAQKLEKLCTDIK